MGRPEPCVLFAQSFVHSQLDEYADDVIFGEPVVVTACEFLEQNASSSSPNIALVGATSPPSFALEAFVHCEGESRFRRLCQPFLYSHSSSNVLEVEAVVTSHLVLRGRYRSLTLVVYGNTAEDLGQFSIDFDLDNSLANVVSSPSEGKLEDLPPALRSHRLSFKDSISSLKSLSFQVPELDLSSTMKQFLLLVFKICQKTDHEKIIGKLVSIVVSAVSSFVKLDSCIPVSWNHHKLGVVNDNPQHLTSVLSDAKHKLLEIYKSFQTTSGSDQILEDEFSLESDADLNLITSELLIDMFNRCFPSVGSTSSFELTPVSQNSNEILALGLIIFLSSSRESCFRFVNSGGMERVVNLLGHEVQKSPAITLLLLGVAERATQHGIGCEGFLGWWPREDENVPVGNSIGYSHLIKLLLGKQRHDVASLATYVLHRLRFYEVVCRYESSVLAVLADLSTEHQVRPEGIESLACANCLLKNILKLFSSFGSIEDLSPVAFARKFLVPGESENLLSYGATIELIAASRCSFGKGDMDKHLLSILKDRGFFPLSAALLSSPIVRSGNGRIADIFVDIATSIQSILLSLLFYRSGLTFLLSQPETTALVILSLQDVEDMAKTDCMTLRQADMFLSKGFFCRPQEIGIIAELHIRVGTAIDRLLTANSKTDELLWVLWELCAISRSDSGRQALLTFNHFPEAISVLMDALRSSKDLDTIDSGASPLSLTIFHSAAEIFEVLVTDSTASSLNSWIGYAMELHRVLHSSSPGSNRKDAPTRLLEWIDAGVVYHKNGAIGLLRYAAFLASGGDAHLTATSVLVSDSGDVENVVGDSISNSDAHLVDNLLGKLVSDKYFDGLALPNSSVVQLTTAVRILAFISENSAVAASLFEEGAVILVYVILVSCKFMLERLSNTYDYLVDEGAEWNSTTDLLLERSHEQNLIDLMIPSLVLLINLLRKLQEVKEQYRSKKLLNALLRLHREVSPKLAACAADLSFPYPSSALGLGAVCHLIASAIAYWPIFSWTPSLFHCLVDSVQATSLLALGPKDACSMLCLLGDLLPEEPIWHWKNEMPPLSALRTLSVGTIMGPQAEEHVNWYLQSEHLALILMRLMPQLDKIAQIVLHFSFTALVVVQDMLRVFIIRIACQKTECAVVLLRPIISWMDKCIDQTHLSDTDVLKVHKLLQFVASLLEHPCATSLLLKVGAIRILDKVLHNCNDVSSSDGKVVLEGCLPSRSNSLLCWSLPAFKSLTLMFKAQQPSWYSRFYDKSFNVKLSVEDSTLIGHHLLKLCVALPVGRELSACVLTLKELSSCSQGRNAILSIYSRIQSLNNHSPDEKDSQSNYPDEYSWRLFPPLRNCWKKLLGSLECDENAVPLVVETVHALSLSALSLCMAGKSTELVPVVKSLFGLSPGDGIDSSEEKFKILHQMIEKLEHMIGEDENSSTSNNTANLQQVLVSVRLMLLLLESTSSSSPMLESIASSELSCSTSHAVHSAIITSKLMPSLNLISTEDDGGLSFSPVWSSNENLDNVDNYLLGSSPEKFVWECPDSLPDRQLMPALPLKRKLSSAEGSGRRVRDNAGSEATGSNAFSRALNMSGGSSGPTRRDTFRQRKPNTSRPPSMHVDDYVARERNIDGVTSGSNIGVSSQRGGSTSGRPPSIHVDEFMARQRERQSPMSVVVGDVSQVRNTSSEIGNDLEKLDKPRRLKADLDEDLHEIDIVFDEESEPDDRLPFPQPDDNLQPAPGFVGGSSPVSIVEESDENTQIVSEDGSSRFDIPSRRSAPQHERTHAPELSVSDKNFLLPIMDKDIISEQSDESRYASPVARSKSFDTPPVVNSARYTSSMFSMSSASTSAQSLPPHTIYQRNSPQKPADGSLPPGFQGYSEQKRPISQPPLPPTPPPSLAGAQTQFCEPGQIHILPSLQAVRDLQPPLPAGRPGQIVSGGSMSGAGINLQGENLSSIGSSSTASLGATQTILDKFSWNMVSSGSKMPAENFNSGRSMPPLPPLPPPFSSPIIQSSLPNSSPQTSLYNQAIASQPPPPSTPLGVFSASGTSLGSYSLPPFSPSLFVSKSASATGTLFGSPTQQHGQSSSNLSSSLLYSVASLQPSMQSMQPRPLPPPPPQLPRPPTPQHSGLPVQVSHSPPDHLMPLQQSSIPGQVQSLQIQQQLQIPQLQFYYQAQQQEPLLQPLQPLLEQSQPQNVQPDNAAQHQKESGMTLQDYFSSPQAIQSLLSDRDKLCELLEQHPKLMQLLQERLGQQ